MNRGKGWSSSTSSTASRPRPPIRELGYPSHAQLAGWHREWQENGGRLTDRSLEQCTLEQKKAAVRHCLTHGRRDALIRRELGYPKCTAKLAEWFDEYAPGMDGRHGHVRFLNGVDIEECTVYNDSTLEDMQRVQIREIIRSHLEKERALFRRGINASCSSSSTRSQSTVT